MEDAFLNAGEKRGIVLRPETDCNASIRNKQGSWTRKESGLEWGMRRTEKRVRGSPQENPSSRARQEQLLLGKMGDEKREGCLSLKPTKKKGMTEVKGKVEKKVDQKKRKLPGRIALIGGKRLARGTTGTKGISPRRRQFTERLLRKKGGCKEEEQKKRKREGRTKGSW